MSYIKFTFVIAAAAMISVPSIADAQSFTQRGTRGGAIAGAIIGGVIGDQRNNAFTGAVIGGLVGGAAGRAIGQRKDAQAFGGGDYYGGSKAYRQSSYYKPSQPYYGGGRKDLVVGVKDYPISRGYGGGYGRGPSCPYGGRW